jgi:hypothetical protein
LRLGTSYGFVGKRLEVWVTVKDGGRERVLKTELALQSCGGPVVDERHHGGRRSGNNNLRDLSFIKVTEGLTGRAYWTLEGVATRVQLDAQAARYGVATQLNSGG